MPANRNESLSILRSGRARFTLCSPWVAGVAAKLCAIWSQNQAYRIKKHGQAAHNFPCQGKKGWYLLLSSSPTGVTSKDLLRPALNPPLSCASQMAQNPRRSGIRCSLYASGELESTSCFVFVAQPTLRLHLLASCAKGGCLFIFLVVRYARPLIASRVKNVCFHFYVSVYLSMSLSPPLLSL
jgi:hypothetical protein